jgi:hypothetical protein
MRASNRGARTAGVGSNVGRIEPNMGSIAGPSGLGEGEVVLMVRATADTERLFSVASVSSFSFLAFFALSAFSFRRESAAFSFSSALDCIQK